MTQKPERSRFVTVVAWIFIVLAGLAALVSVAQNLLIFVLLRDPEWATELTTPIPGMPGVLSWMLAHMQILALAGLLTLVFICVASVGLLRRQEWGRWCFIGGLGWLVLCQLSGIGVQVVTYTPMEAALSAATSAASAPDMSVTDDPSTHDYEPIPDAPDMNIFYTPEMYVGMFLTNIIVFSVTMALGSALLFGWIIQKLLSAPIAAEFR